jgi:peptide/nickel transport system permease protein
MTAKAGRSSALPRSVRWGVGLILALLVLAAGAPWLTPLPPELQLDPVAGRHLRPLSARQAIQLHDGRWLLAEEARRTPRGLLVKRLGREELLPLESIANLTVEGVRDRRFFLLGTDRFARDLWSRIAYGARVSLAIGILATAISLMLGTLVGGLAALLGGWVDRVLMRLVDALLMFPRMFLILTVAAFVETRFWIVILVLGFTGWMSVSRLARAELLSLRERDFVVAARAAGQHPLRIFLRHMLPNALSPLVVDTTLRVGSIMLVEAALSFLGLGVQPPTPSWGNIVADGADALVSAWWVAAFPGLAICVTVIAFNLLGEGLQHRLDPRRPDRRPC